MLAGRSSLTKRIPVFVSGVILGTSLLNYSEQGPWPKAKQNRIFCKCVNAQGACATLSVSVRTDRTDIQEPRLNTELARNCTNVLPIQTNDSPPNSRKYGRPRRSIYIIYQNAYLVYCEYIHKSCQHELTLILLKWTIWWAPSNASKWRMGFNSAFNGLICLNFQKFFNLLTEYKRMQLLIAGRDSSVGIATRHGVDGLGIESLGGRDFPHPSRPALGPTQPPVQRVPGLSRG